MDFRDPVKDLQFSRFLILKEPRKEHVLSASRRPHSQPGGG